MTSLVSASKDYILETKASNEDELHDSLFAVWRRCQNAKLSRKRLSNRSWRLMSEKLLNRSHKATDESLLHLQDQLLFTTTQPIYTCDQVLPERPSLFLDLSRHTSNSILTLQKLKPSEYTLAPVSGDESSDISEDDSLEGDDLDHEPSRKGQAVGSPLSTKRKSSVSKVKAHAEARSVGKSDFKHEDTSLSRRNENSLEFRRNIAKNNGNIFFISNSPSSLERDKPGSRFSPGHEASTVTPNAVERKDSLFTNAAAMSVSSFTNDASSLSSTDISEVSDADDHPTCFQEDDLDINVAESRSMKSGKSLKLVDDNESEWMSVSSESEEGSASPETQPISFAKRIPIPQVGAADDSKLSPPAEETLKSSPSSLRPRSLLSGLFLSEMSTNTSRSPLSIKSAKDESKSAKPVLKRSSTTGVITIDECKTSRGLQRPSILLSKRYASSSDFANNVVPHRSPVLYVAEEETMKEDVSISGERNLFAKQTSSVGLSNYLATADGRRKSDPKSSSKNIETEASSSTVDNLLSSSLSKYGSLQRQSSLKNIFSKSSISLTSLLGHGITGKIKLHSENKSSENMKALLSQQPQQPVVPMASLFAEHLSQQSLMDQSASDSTILTGKSVRVEPKIMKDFQPSVDVSDSLKDSLMIDHKLGKAPLPDRVISDEDLFSGHDKNTFVHESNDYHSKGW